MTREDLFYAIGEVDEMKVEAALRERRRPARLSRPLCALIAAALLLAACASAYAVELERRYNAAVGYLQSLGIRAEDLSDYTRSEVREAAQYLRATEPAPAELSEKYMALYEKVYGKHDTPPARPDRPAQVTSDQVRRLTPTMTAREVMDALGETQDIGSGLLILLYEVDGDSTLTIPFTNRDAQLGVTGETLLEALQPK